MSAESHLPRIPVSLVRATAPWKRAATATTQLPDLRGRVESWRPKPQQVADYRRVVGSSAVVPLSYPQVAVMALHLDLISSLAFPIRAMGLIHLASDVQVLGELPPAGPWSVRAWVGPGRHVRSGLEFDLYGEVAVAGDVRWTSRATMLSRSRAAEGAEASTSPDVAVPTAGEPWADPVPVPVAEGVGRAFGRVTGDVNPIHLHALPARAFGFRSAIAHGWWLTGRIAAILDADACAPGRRLRIVFRRPVALPSTPSLLAREASVAAVEGTAPGHRFALVTADQTPGDQTPGDQGPGDQAAADPGMEVRALAYGEITG